MAEAFYSLTDPGDILPVHAAAWAAALEALARLSLDDRRPQAAMRIIADLGEAPAAGLTPLHAARARIGGSLALFHAGRGRLEEALEAYSLIASGPATPESAVALARTAAGLIPLLCAEGMENQAAEVCLGLRILPRSPEVRECLKGSAERLLARIGAAADRAEELCLCLAETGGEPVPLAEAAARAITAAARAGQHSRAVEFYLELAARRPVSELSPQAARPLAWAIAALAESCRAAKRARLAREIIRHLQDPAFQEAVRDIRACLETGPASGGRPGSWARGRDSGRGMSGEPGAGCLWREKGDRRLSGNGRWPSAEDSPGLRAAAELLRELLCRRGCR
ncbi:MAG: hypothetical protein LBW85_00950 [Deltaproteobacteria bacterium]|jgi:hypothetical protein|nr:hypothetical protein [Deltaproteobacteria bacterium]